MTYTIREYTHADERSWLRCRVLSFLYTAYYDDVDRAKPTIPAPGLELVAVDQTDTVVGIMDTMVAGTLATIDTVAVHPDHQHRGLGRALLQKTCIQARDRQATTLDAWTRDDPDTLRWYRAMGFKESDHYLHVYAHAYTAADEPDHVIVKPRPGLRLMSAFLHAKLADEAQLRREFSRVHVCRRFAMTL
ncbi:GNAT family N-acetyltransferase [Streptomyces sp. NBC_01142]|uniref:GNAT family N-acetyltransferase n=1 Tax=Streptomyces sp. NBC_01142 TaxID=2975865 RepID=UPI00225B9775|nr:GNAT family N-acetyltransferase [Streptomyces sp. NBC_01142]MCX4826871.1 GNAT family N-acetyltransferase [Streptomyces sp. NBC_01142]